MYIKLKHVLIFQEASQYLVLCCPFYIYI